MRRTVDSIRTHARVLQGIAGFDDLRFAWRGLRRAPGFALASVLTLALGLGANLALFTLVHQVLLSPLPYPEPDRLTVLWAKYRDRPDHWGQISFGDFVDIAALDEVFASASLIYLDEVTLLGDGPAARIPSRTVSHGLFRQLGVTPLLGRSFAADEGREGSDDVALLSHQLWRGRFGGDPEIVGRIVSIDGTPTEIVGVLPAGFDLAFPEAGAALWKPLAEDVPRLQGNRAFYAFYAVMQLASEVSIERANEALAATAARLETAYPETNAGRVFTVTPLREELVGDVRPALLLLSGAVVLILLIAGANSASLLLGRLTARRAELAVRAALGAGRGRLIRQLLIESLLLAALAGTAAAVLAIAILHLVTRTGWEAPVGALEPGPPVIAFGLLLTLATGLVFGTVPALIMTRLGAAGALHGARASAWRAPLALRGSLVAGQIGLATMLLIVSGLLLASMREIVEVETGFDRRGLLTAYVALPGDRYPSPTEVVAYLRAAREALEALPGVTAAGVSSTLPLEGRFSGSWVSVEGRPIAPGRVPPTAGYQQVMPGWFEALGVPLLSGRPFTASDVDAARHLSIINRTAAEQLFPGEDPVGKRIKLGPPDSSDEWHEIVGVVADVRTRGLLEEHRPEAYDLMGAHWGRTRTLAVRVDGAPGALAPTVRRALEDLDPQVAIYRLRTLDDVARAGVGDRQRLLELIAALALVALALAAVGIYGVMAYSVLQRRREMGIRMALGSTPAEVLSLVLGRGARLVAIGLGAGLAGTAMLTSWLQSYLIRVSALEPSTYAAVSVLLAAIGIAACAGPALRAGATDPARAIRDE